jgi:acyl-CoA reductase-like NAD-dependent aldehyde dehydrogenase
MPPRQEPLRGHNSLYIEGRWVPAAGSGAIPVLSPNTGEVIGSVPEAEYADLDRAVHAARNAFDDSSGWRSWEPARRAAALRRFADALERRGGDLAATISAQNGMPISTASRVDAVFPCVLLRLYADLVEGQSVEDVRRGLLGGDIAVVKQPVGVVGAIVPWNFPQTLAFCKIAPALASGCTVVLKPACETVLDSVIVAEAAIDAELPAGVLNIVPGGRDLGARLVSHPGVDKVAFTGSTTAGRLVGQACGRLIRPVSLELGGKSAAIVLDDVDLDLAAIGDALFNATLLNNGQTGFRRFPPRRRLAPSRYPGRSAGQRTSARAR